MQTMRMFTTFFAYEYALSAFNVCVFVWFSPSLPLCICVLWAMHFYREKTAYIIIAMAVLLHFFGDWEQNITLPHIRRIQREYNSVHILLERKSYTFYVHIATKWHSNANDGDDKDDDNDNRQPLFNVTCTLVSWYVIFAHCNSNRIRGLRIFPFSHTLVFLSLYSFLGLYLQF